MDTRKPPDTELLVRELFNARTFRTVRDRVRKHIRRAGVDPTRTEFFTTAVNEGLINAVEHGGGGGEVTLVRDDASRLVAVVEDHGPVTAFPVPTAAPAPKSVRGRGLWLASQLCDKLTVRRSGGGNALVLELSIAP